MVWQREDKGDYGLFLEKQKFILILFVLSFICLSLRLFELQIVKGNEYKRISEQQRIYNTRERAPRGLIYSADNQLLAGNELIYTVLFHPFSKNYAPSNETLKELENILGREITLPLNKNNNRGKVIKLVDNLSLSEMFKIQERKFKLPDISIEKEPRRVYYAMSAGHVTGYTSEINNEELKKLSDSGYKMGDYIGRGGIEQFYDEYLKGEDGGWQVEVNARGYQTKVFKYIPYKIGASIYSTIDLRLQETAFNALKDSNTGQGAVVILDVKTGAVKALVSCPVFDANKTNSKEFFEYLKDIANPIFNRALQAQYAPGSIFKIITFSAAVDYLNINVNETTFCRGKFELGNRKYACWYKPGHGKMNLIRAMENSCNVYFYQLGLKLGVNIIEKYARKFYLGQKTGIDLPNEKRGFVPSREWKKEKTKMSWLQGDTVILAIGQGALWVTPLQMVQMMSLVANRGVSFKPYVVEKIVDVNDNEVYKHISEPNKQLIMSDATWNLLHSVLLGTVEYGTAGRVKLKGIKIAGKTGTAQNPHGDDHAWFVSYAPADNPEIAIAVVVENGGGGGANAVPIAKKVYETYFNVEYSDMTNEKKSQSITR
jgi:penicillin-binding protein 2